QHAVLSRLDALRHPKEGTGEVDHCKPPKPSGRRYTVIPITIHGHSTVRGCAVQTCEHALRLQCRSQGQQLQCLLASSALLAPPRFYFARVLPLPCISP
ncbi:MAG: hypothetical protein ACK559_32700, partial [bacterium]